MRKLLTLTLCLVAGVCAVVAQQTSKITGNITNLPDGTEITLCLSVPGGRQEIEKKTSQNGEFSFDITPDKLTRYLLMPPSGMGLSVWLEPGKDAVVTGDGVLFLAWDVESDVARQQQYNVFNRARKNYIIEEDSLRKVLATIREQQKSAGSSEMVDLFRMQSKGVDAQLEAVQEEWVKTLLEVARQSEPSDEVVERLQIVAKHGRFTDAYPGYVGFKDEVAALYEGLPDNYKNSPEGKKIYDDLKAPVQLKVGDSIPALEAFDLSGKAVKLTDFKGKYILVDVWARWCGPCIALLPKIKELAEKFEGRVVVVNLSLDDKETWKNLSEKHGVTWTNLNDFKGDMGLAAYFYSGMLPAFTIVDPEGVVVEQGMYGHYEEMLQKYLDK